MPTVPSYGGLRESTSVAPGAEFARPTGPTPGDIGAEQASRAGQALTSAGAAATNIATSQLDLANQVRVNDAMNKAREHAQALTYDPQVGYLNLKGDAALTRPDGQALPDEYGTKLQKGISDIAGTLGNDAQRRMFGMQSSGLATQFQGDVEKHMLGEFREYALSTQDGTMSLAVDSAKRGWNNPDSIFGAANPDGSKNPGALDAAKAAVYQKGKLLGWSGAQTDAALLTTSSMVHTSVVMSALENNQPGYALAWLDKNKGSMTADDILRVQGHVNQQVWANTALDAVQKATTDLKPQIQPTSFDRMVTITAGTESGGRDFKPDGSVLEGPNVPGQGTAKGRMQVMDATAANPGFGIKPAITTGTSQQIADDRARVGKEYLQAMVQKYGDPAKAWAAYNAGPDIVDKALADSAKDPASATTPYDWLNKLAKYQSPANHIQTVGYVDQNMKALGSGTGGIQPRPTELDFVNAALGKLPAGAPPQLVMHTREQAISQFGVINKSLNESADNAQRAAQSWLAQNGGDINQMPTSLRDAVMTSAPGKMEELTNYARSIAKGPNVDNPVLFNRLAAHPDELAGLSDVQFESLRPSLSNRSFDRFSIQRAGYLNGTTKNGPDQLDVASFNRSFTDRLAALQIPTSYKPTDVEGQQWMHATQNYLREGIYDAQKQIGRKFTADEIDRYIGQAWTKDTTFRQMALGFIPMGHTDAQPILSLKFGDLPSESADQIRQRLISEGNAAPTNSDILNRYRAVKMGANRPPPGALPGRGSARAIPAYSPTTDEGE